MAKDRAEALDEAAKANTTAADDQRVADASAAKATVATEAADKAAPADPKK